MVKWLSTDEMKSAIRLQFPTEIAFHFALIPYEIEWIHFSSFPKPNLAKAAEYADCISAEG